ncbi:MAG: MaoC family dehydratase [Oscillospiraceae bacterium]|nr:MaoC family dehydratase [Oscillospiraceae bacterium]
MNEYRINDLSVGMTESFEWTITREMVDFFGEISGDMNPLHTDVDYATSLGYPDTVVYGMLSASLYSTMAGMYLPGKYCLLQQMETKFRKPVFVGDTLTVTGKVIQHTSFPAQIVVECKIRNQNGVLVNSGKYTALVT